MKLSLMLTKNTTISFAMMETKTKYFLVKKMHFHPSRKRFGFIQLYLVKKGVGPEFIS